VQDLCFAIQGGDNWNVHFDRDGSGSQGSKATTVTAEGKKTIFFGSTFYILKMHHFTKTGSGQT